MKTVNLTVNNGQVKVQTPYNAEFVTKAKNLGGKWDTLSKSWIFNESVLDYVKEILLQIYGVTGETTYQTCTLIVKNYSAEIMNNAVELFGRTIARASGRDTGVSLGDGLVWINGKKESGGSTKYWKTIVENATFEIQNFPFERTKFEDVQKAIAEGWCEIKVTESKRSKEEIKSEIAELKEKLAKLEEELNNL
jgi:hypothetical protein